MTDPEWDFLVAALNDRDNPDRAVEAAVSLHKNATIEDVPRMRELLRNGDLSVCEAVGWPLSELGVTKAIPDLLEALYRGEQEGYDNDGLAAAVADLAEAHSQTTRIVLDHIRTSDRSHLHPLADWLLPFCNTDGSA